MSWVDHITHNVEAIGAAVIAALVSLMARTWFQDRKRLTALEVKHDEFKQNTEHEMDRLAAAIEKVDTNLTACNVSVTDSVARVATAVEFLAKQQGEMNTKLDKINDQKHNTKS